MTKKRLRVVIAPDSYKGSLPADQAALAIARGLTRCPTVQWDVVCVPMADGGEGTGIVVRSLGGELVSAGTETVYGVPHSAHWIRWGSKAVIEAAVGSGFVPASHRQADGEYTTSRGTGLLVASALADPAIDEIFVALGGTGSTDGGMGFLQALGAQFFDATGRPLKACGSQLGQVARYVPIKPLSKPVIGLYDVGVPLLGERGAVYQFGPQKGVAPERLAAVDAAMGHYAEIVHSVGGAPVDFPGAGAAGGIGFGILAAGGRLQGGAQTVAQWCCLDAQIAEADWVITGEGQLDQQTSEGKVVAWVLRIAQQHHKPVIALVGSRSRNLSHLHRQGLALALSIGLAPMSLEAAMAATAESLEAAGEEVGWFLGHAAQASVHEEG